MFLQIPLQFTTQMRNTVLILNTVLLFAILVGAEVYYSTKSADSKPNMRVFYPFMAVIVGILIYAACVQAGRS
jgi:hypothetical protein